MNTSIKHLLERKGHDVWNTSPNETVQKALQRMADKDVGALLVFDDVQLVGIFSERDYARKVFLQGKSADRTMVSEIMTPNVVCIKASQTVAECMALMTDKHIRHLPVLENDTVIGVISIGDVVKEIISEQEFVIKQLENYITGNR
jgi:signal-transduction protein with cAMP-binding, CBS, and nucleotidyltransferase domain